MRRAAVLVAVLSLVAAPALGQDRDPAARDALVSLAYVLGQAHALTQLCAPGDQHWRSRMLSMVQTEGADHAFAERLRGQFNAGYLAGQARFPACSPASRAVESEVEAQGAALARRIGQASVTPPDSLARPGGPG